MRQEPGRGEVGACGPKNTFTWQGRELGLSGSNPGCPPKWQRWGMPLTRARVRVLLAPPCQPERLARPGPSHLLGQHRMAARELGQLFQFVQLSPKAAKPRGYFGPTPDTSASPGERSCSQRVPWAGLRQASCANCWPPASSYPMARLPGGLSVALGARQDRSTGPVSPLPQNNSVFFLSAS